MKINTLFSLIVFFAAVNFCQGQTVSGRPGLRLLTKGISFSHSIGHKKTAAVTSVTTTTLPLILKTRNGAEADLFSQLINWDCKLKVKLNSNFNFILSYN